MGKASTNAGKDPYLRPDFQSDLKQHDKPGIPFSTKAIQFVETLVKTEYKDKNQKDLYFKDVVKIDEVTYVIDYDPRNFRWILFNEKRTISLREAHKRTVLVKKCSARQNF